MIRQNRLLLILTLTVLTLNSSNQKELNPVFTEMSQVSQFINTFGNHGALIDDFNRIYNSLNIPKELKEELLTLLRFQKPGVLALFGPKGQTLSNYLEAFTKLLGQEWKVDLTFFRNHYLEKIITNLQDFSLLAEIIEYGTNNGFTFERHELGGASLLYKLMINLPEKMPQEIPRIINCLPNLINKQDSWGFTPLMDAVNKNRLDLAKLLISAKTNLEFKTTTLYTMYTIKYDKSIPAGSTALDIAVLNKNLDLINLLLQSGADLNNTKALGEVDNKDVAGAIKAFRSQQKQIIDSALHDELPQVLVNLVCEYLASKKEVHHV